MRNFYNIKLFLQYIIVVTVYSGGPEFFGVLDSSIAAARKPSRILKCVSNYVRASLRLYIFAFLFLLDAGAVVRGGVRRAERCSLDLAGIGVALHVLSSVTAPTSSPAGDFFFQNRSLTVLKIHRAHIACHKSCINSRSRHVYTTINDCGLHSILPKNRTCRRR